LRHAPFNTRDGSSTSFLGKDKDKEKEEKKERMQKVEVFQVERQWLLLWSGVKQHTVEASQMVCRLAISLRPNS
tara:strand:- start:127 stop:348 length:222 start_codon:yes stop_codon:yes gene_type:complete